MLILGSRGFDYKYSMWSLYSLLYLDTITFSLSGSIKRTSSESSEATDIVTPLGLSGGSEKGKINCLYLNFIYLGSAYYIITAKFQGNILTLMLG